MTLLADVVACLELAPSPHAMIGATALAALGASRSTQDLDLLTTDRAVLRRSYWNRLESTGAMIDIRSGDIQDPLVGVVRLTRDGERPVDVIVGEAPWQDRVLSDASLRQVADVEVPVIDEVGLVLLKLYAGGPQDLWDIEQLLAVAVDRNKLQADVDRRMVDLPPRCRRLWKRIVQPEG